MEAPGRKNRALVCERKKDSGFGSGLTEPEGPQIIGLIRADE